MSGKPPGTWTNLGELGEVEHGEVNFVFAYGTRNSPCGQAADAS